MIWHLAIALLIQAGIAKALRMGWWAGAAAAVSWAVSREIAQAEYRWIERYGEGLRANMPWWGPLDLRVWHGDALVDWVLPTIVVVAIAWAMTRREVVTNRTPD